MSLPNNDREGRFRNKTIAFRVSDDENREIESLVAFSDMTKQDYLVDRVFYGNQGGIIRFGITSGPCTR